MLPQRYGRFTVNVDDFQSERFPEILNILEFRPVRVEHMYHMQSFEYIGYSPLFRIIKRGEKYPTYQIIGSTEDIDGTISVTVSEIK